MKYKVVTGVLSKNECVSIINEFNKLDIPYDKNINPEVPGYTQNLYNFKVAGMLQESLTTLMCEEFKKNLGITYSFTRKYTKRSEMKKHTDRYSCEYSMTLHLGSSDNSNPWPIYFEMNDKKTYIDLKPGDACLYKGIEVPHGREPCPVDWYLQMFLHWVDLDGEYKEYLGDKRTI